MRLFTPSSGPPWLRQFADSIISGLKQQLSAPLWLWSVATADLPTTPELGANTGALAYDTTDNRLTYYNGSAWKQTVTYTAALGALGALTPAANKVPYFTSGTAAALADFTASGRALVALTIAQGDLLYGSGAGTAAVLAKDTNAQRVLTNGGTSNNPAWAQVSLTAGVTGILPGANGGTNNGFMAFAGPATSLKTFTLPNASATILTDNAAVTAAQGGTGIASYAVGDILYASGATTLSKLADVATGNVLISGGVTTAPSWGKVGLTTHVSGTLGVGNGGTGVTTSTGSGNNVLSSGPTLSGAITVSADTSSYLSLGRFSSGFGRAIIDTPSPSTGWDLQVQGVSQVTITSTQTAFGATIKVGSYTVAGLPAAGTAGAGAVAFVTDATATTFASTVVGGGANKVPVYSDGSNWKIG